MGIKGEFTTKTNQVVASINNTLDGLFEQGDWKSATFIFLVIPAFLVSVELAILSDYWILADITRSGLYLQITGQSLFSLETLIDTYLSSMAHENWTPHLRGNLVSYLMCMTAFYPMAVLGGKKSELLKLYVFVLIAAPIVTTVYSFFYIGGETIGFSGVVTAYYGLLPVAMFVMIDSKTDVRVNPIWSVMLLFLVYSAFFLYVGNITTALSVSVPALFFILGMTYSIGLAGWKEVIDVIFGGTHFTVFLALCVFCLGFTMTYTNLDPNVNHIAHISGYSFGFMAGFVYLSDFTEISM